MTYRTQFCVAVGLFCTMIAPSSLAFAQPLDTEVASNSAVDNDAAALSVFGGFSLSAGLNDSIKLMAPDADPVTFRAGSGYALSLGANYDLVRFGGHKFGVAGEVGYKFWKVTLVQKIEGPDGKVDEIDAASLGYRGFPLTAKVQYNYSDPSPLGAIVAVGLQYEVGRKAMAEVSGVSADGDAENAFGYVLEVGTALDFRSLGADLVGRLTLLPDEENLGLFLRLHYSLL